MKYFLLCLSMTISIASATYAKLMSEIYFITGDIDELWIRHINNTENARVFLSKKESVLTNIWELSVQRDGSLIVVVADETANWPFSQEAYLIDTTESPKVVRKLTHHRVDDVFDIDISPRGDLVFTNSLIDDGDAPPKYGIYLISHHEIKKASPKITLLKEIIAADVTWSSDNEHIAYTSADGVFVFNIRTDKTLHVSKVGSTPIFSPDGKKLAFSLRGWGFDNRVASELRIVSFPTLRPFRTIKGLIKHEAFINLKWSPNGKYIVYKVNGIRTPISPGIQHIAVHINGGPHENILNEPTLPSVDVFDWAPSSYTVTPKSRLTTLWGVLKTENAK